MTATLATPDEGLVLAQKIADLFREYPQVEAVTLSGSRTSGAAVDERSDIDLFVHSETGEFPLEERRAILERLGGATRADLGLRNWGDGDVWFHARSGVEVDVVYSSKRWTEEALERILRQHQPSGGYSTCAWHPVRPQRLVQNLAGIQRPALPARAAPGHHRA